MQFSKNYRESLLANIKATFNVSNSDAAQTTYFFSGVAPTLEELTSVLNAEWINPTGDRLAPTHELSSYNSQLAGYCPDFLSSMQWSNHDQVIALNVDLTDDIDSNTTNYVAPVALLGEPTGDVVVQGFSHTTQGDTTLTWALTLWDGTSEASHAIYVLHQIGTLFDSQAEIVVDSPVLASDSPVLPIINVYSPVL